MNAKADHRVVDMQGTGFVWEDDHRSSAEMIREILSDGQPRSIRQLEADTGLSYNSVKDAVLNLVKWGEADCKQSRTPIVPDGTGNRRVKIYRRKLQ